MLKMRAFKVMKRMGTRSQKFEKEEPNNDMTVDLGADYLIFDGGWGVGRIPKKISSEHLN